MSDKHPTYNQLSPFGKCVIDKDFETRFTLQTAKQPHETADGQRERLTMKAALQGAKNKLRDIDLETSGIDYVIDSAPEAVADCMSKLPRNTSPHALKKAARLYP